MRSKSYKFRKTKMSDNLKRREHLKKSKQSINYGMKQATNSNTSHHNNFLKTLYI
jgi:hypothetical protein